MIKRRSTGLTRRALLGGAAVLFPGIGAAATVAGPVRLGWQDELAANAAVAVARAGGLLTAVELVSVESGTDLVDQLRQGRVDACVGPALSLMLPLQGGLDAKLTTGLSGGGLRLLATRRAKLRHIEDMKGRTIGVGRLDGSAKLFFSIMMRRKGIDPFREVTWVEVARASQADALSSGTVDALAIPDPNAFALRERMRLVEIATDISGSYRDRTAIVLACGGPLLRDNPDRAASLTRALLEAAISVAHNPAAAAAAIAPLAPDLSDVDRTRMLRAEASDQHPTGAALVEDIAAYADELRLVGLFPYALNAGKWARSVCRLVT